MIQWEAARDRHIRGQCEFGQLWVRLDREGKPTGIYTMFGKTRKFVPEKDYTIDDAKTVAALAIEDEKLKRLRERDLS
jgi:hypothetical protein